MVHRLAMLAVVFSSFVSLSEQLHGGEKYFYSKGEKSYYCVRPIAPSEGCFIVSDQPGVKSIDGFKVITTQAADLQVKLVAVPVSPVRTTGGSVDSCYCPSPVPSGECYTPPLVLDGCNCQGKVTHIPINFPQGKLKVCCRSTSFYQAIGTIDGTIAVPQICALETETYLFRGKMLNFPCKDADFSGTECIECKSADCSGNCSVKTCEVYERQLTCKLKCESCYRTGKLLIAIRTEKDSAGNYIADVFIGKVGKVDFPEYPENTVVARGDEKTVKDQLKNQNIKFEDILKLMPAKTDLIAELK